MGRGEWGGEVTKRQVFYSFHYGNDAFRVNQIRNMGVIDGNSPVSENDWEKIKRTSPAAVMEWIDDSMKYRSCVIVLIGAETANRHWVQYEIRKAWNEGKGLFGIYIDELRNIDGSICHRGGNPFERVLVNWKPLSKVIRVYTPPASNVYGYIKDNLLDWVEKSISQRNKIMEDFIYGD